jgi:hypothetical protein
MRFTTFIDAKRKTPAGETSPVSVALGRAKSVFLWRK